MKHEAWRTQKELQKKYSNQDLPSIDEIDSIISRIKIGKVNTNYYTQRAKALFAMYYLTAGRATEILKTTKLRRRKVRRKVSFENGAKKVLYELDESNKPIVDHWLEYHNYLGTMKCDIKPKEFFGYSFLELRIENRKNKKRNTKLLLVPIEKEKAIVKYLMDYIESLEDDEVLFKFGRRRAAQIIKETTGFNIHFIRHIRTTHLITIYDFNEQMLVKYAGWTDARPAKAYIELRTSNMAREFLKWEQRNG